MIYASFIVTEKDQNTTAQIDIHSFNSPVAAFVAKHPDPSKLEILDLNFYESENKGSLINVPINIASWINNKINPIDNFQDRDKTARQKWVTQCYSILKNGIIKDGTRWVIRSPSILQISKDIEVSHEDTFVERIRRMNIMFKLPVNDKLTNLGKNRIYQFEKVLREEVKELLQAVKSDDSVDFTALADCLGDIVVFCFSEAQKWGIPLYEVLHLIMDSQDSKLVNGQPIYSEDGSKFIKGPDFKPPEQLIEALLKQYTD